MIVTNELPPPLITTRPHTPSHTLSDPRDSEYFPCASICYKLLFQVERIKRNMKWWTDIDFEDTFLESGVMCSNVTGSDCEGLFMTFPR